jgi:hypothetical protein
VILTSAMAGFVVIRSIEGNGQGADSVPWARVPASHKPSLTELILQQGIARCPEVGSRYLLEYLAINIYCAYQTAHDLTIYKDTVIRLARTELCVRYFSCHLFF